MNKIPMPDLEPMYQAVCQYVKDKQGEKGYIDCQPSLNGDIIYGFIFDDYEYCGVEKYVYAVRVVEDDLQVLLEDISINWRTVYTHEDYTSEDNDWYSIRWGDVYYIPTLFNIAENIEEY